MHQRPIVVSLAALRAQAAHRPEGYLADVVSHGNLVGEAVELPPQAHRALVAKYRQPAAEWPLWAFLAAIVFAAPGDRGLGDTLARTLGGAGSEAFKRHSEVVFGVWEPPCGHCGKVAGLNAQYPYSGE